MAHLSGKENSLVPGEGARPRIRAARPRPGDSRCAGCRAAGLLKYNPLHAPLELGGGDQLAVGVAGGGCISCRRAERRGGRGIVSVVSRDAGHEDSAGSGECDEYGGDLAGPADVGCRVLAGRAQEPARCVADGSGRIDGRHGRSGGAAEHAAEDISCTWCRGCCWARRRSSP